MEIAEVMVSLADKTFIYVQHPAKDPKYLEMEFNSYLSAMRQGVEVEYPRVIRDKDGNQIGYTEKPSIIIGVRWHNLDSEEVYAEEAVSPDPTSIAVEMSLVNAIRGGDEPIWNMDLDKISENAGKSPEVAQMINKVKAIRLYKTGSTKPIKTKENVNEYQQ